MQKRIRNRAADRHLQAHRARVRKAENEVLRYLEKRWEDHLEGRTMPKAMRDDMRRHPAFRAMVQQRLEGKPFVHEDRDHTPDVVRTLDGQLSNRMVDELGGDPNDYLCPECGEAQEKPLAGEMCEECKGYFRVTT